MLTELFPEMLKSFARSRSLTFCGWLPPVVAILKMCPHPFVRITKMPMCSKRLGISALEHCCSLQWCRADTSLSPGILSYALLCHLFAGYYLNVEQIFDTSVFAIWSRYSVTDIFNIWEYVRVGNLRDFLIWYLSKAWVHGNFFFIDRISIHRVSLSSLWGQLMTRNNTGRCILDCSSMRKARTLCCTGGNPLICGNAWIDPNHSLKKKERNVRRT